MPCASECAYVTITKSEAAPGSEQGANNDIPRPEVQKQRPLSRNGSQVTATGHDVSARAEGAGKEDSGSRHGHWLRAHTTLLRYSLTSFPPLPVALFVALQHLLVSLASALTVSTVVSDALCADPGHPIRARMLTTTLFMSGTATIMQTLLGIRLPVFQGASSSFLVPLLALNNIPGWECSPLYASQRQRPLTDGAANSTSDDLRSSGNSSHVALASGVGSFTIENKLQQLSGSLMVASLLEIFIGGCGLIRPLLRRIGPLTVAPTIGLIGLSLYKLPSDYAALNPGVALGSALLVILFSLYMARFQVPIPSCKKGRKPTRFPVFQLLPILLAMMLMWLFCLIMTATNVFPDDRKHVYYYSRTDAKSNIIRETPWFQITYPGQFGSPSFSLPAFIGFSAAICASFVESVGDYFATAKCCHVMPPPNHAISRGILVEGVASFLSGTVGAAHATTSYSQNISLLRLTKTVSRWVLVMAGGLLIIFSLVGKIGATLTTMPAPILGGIFIVILGMLTILGLSCLEYADMTSDRNLIVTGVALISGLVVPNFVDKYGDMLDTGLPSVDQVIKVVLGTPMFLGGMVALFLDNTVPGTEEERGIKAWREAHASPDEEAYEFVSGDSSDDDDDDVGAVDSMGGQVPVNVPRPDVESKPHPRFSELGPSAVDITSPAGEQATVTHDVGSNNVAAKKVHPGPTVAHCPTPKIRSMREVFSLPSEDEVYAFAFLKGRLGGRFWKFLPFLPPNAYSRRMSVRSEHVVEEEAPGTESLKQEAREKTI